MVRGIKIPKSDGHVSIKKFYGPSIKQDGLTIVPSHIPVDWCVECDRRFIDRSAVATATT